MWTLTIVLAGDCLVCVFIVAVLALDLAQWALSLQMSFQLFALHLCPTLVAALDLYISTAFVRFKVGL